MKSKVAMPCVFDTAEGSKRGGMLYGFPAFFSYTDGAKDSAFSRRRLIQRFPIYSDNGIIHPRRPSAKLFPPLQSDSRFGGMPNRESLKQQRDPIDQPVYHAGCQSVDKHRPGNGKHFTSHA